MQQFNLNVKLDFYNERKILDRKNKMLTLENTAYHNFLFVVTDN